MFPLLIRGDREQAVLKLYDVTDLARKLASGVLVGIWEWRGLWRNAYENRLSHSGRLGRRAEEQTIKKKINFDPFIYREDLTGSIAII